MPGAVIGKFMNYGFAGTYARHPEAMIYTFANDSEKEIPFGAAVIRSTTPQDGAGLPAGFAAGTVGCMPADATITMANFLGVASREVKSALNYTDQSAGAYLPHEAVAVFERGSISVLVQGGTPVRGGKVYVRTVADGAFPIGSWTADSGSGTPVEITNAQWGGPADTRGICELMLLTRANA